MKTLEELTKCPGSSTEAYAYDWDSRDCSWPKSSGLGFGHPCTPGRATCFEDGLGPEGHGRGRNITGYRQDSGAGCPEDNKYLFKVEGIW